MDKKLLDEIIASLPKERTLFRYARNDYALMLLSRVVRKGMKTGDLRRSSFGRLLDKPYVRNLLSDIGGGYLSGDAFDYVYVKERQDFLLTVGRWNEERSRYNQTTRNSANLVLQLNFNSGHDGEFDRLIGRSKINRFKCYGHPVLKKGERPYYRNTMAWVRMDVDLHSGEVLIEEIQTDWLRYAKRYVQRLERCMARDADCDRRETNRKILQAVKLYIEKTLAPFGPMWDEAALTAAINFAIDELGVDRLYYHTYETGNVLKGLQCSRPPRSLYTDLPRKFCFELTDETPEMFSQSTAAKRKLRRARAPRWYRLNLEVQS